MKPKLQTTALLLLSLLYAANVFAQVTQLWVARYNGSGNQYDHATAVGVDQKGNVYVTGFGIGLGTGEDYATIKYDPQGTQIWARRFNLGWDPARSLAVDAAGNVYVAGGSGTIKYDTHGNLKWVQPGDGNRIIIGADKFIYVIGDNGAYKFDSTGNLIWQHQFCSEAFGIIADTAGNVYAVGSEYRDEWRIAKFDAAGNRLWLRTYKGNSYGLQMARYVCIDPFGDIVVTGWITTDSTQQDAVVAKYNASGVQLWTASIDGPLSIDDAAEYTTIDAAGNIIVTGEVNYVGDKLSGDIFVAKLNRSGQRQWIKYYNGPGNAEDRSTNMQMDEAGNLYITGFSFGAGTSEDYVLLKYDPSGNQLWTTRYDGPANGWDMAEGLALDDDGNIYLTGTSMGTGTDRDFATIKYSQQQMVANFTLMDAVSNAPIRDLSDGDTLNLAQLPSTRLNIRANTLPAKVGSVQMVLTGRQARKQVENGYPYALFGDQQGVYNDWTPQNGDYALTATPYRSTNASGTIGMSKTIHFNVLYQKATEFVLVNAETDQDIRTIQPNDQIDLSTLPTRQLNIRVVTQPGRVGSVVFRLNNWLQVTENHFPYAIGGDVNGNFRPWTLPVGNHTLTATPYQWRNGAGQKGATKSIRLTVTDPLSTAGISPAGKASERLLPHSARLTIIPNPANSHTTVFFQPYIKGTTTIALYNNGGQMVSRLYHAHTNPGQQYQVSVHTDLLIPGSYYVHLVNGKHSAVQQLVVQEH